MATNSILRDIHITDKNLGKSFVNALENAKSKKCEEVIISKPVKQLDRAAIKEIFANKC